MPEGGLGGSRQEGRFSRPGGTKHLKGRAPRKERHQSRHLGRLNTLGMFSFLCSCFGVSEALGSDLARSRRCERRSSRSPSPNWPRASFLKRPRWRGQQPEADKTPAVASWRVAGRLLGASRRTKHASNQLHPNCRCHVADIKPRTRRNKTREHRGVEMTPVDPGFTGLFFNAGFGIPTER